MSESASSFIKKIVGFSLVSWVTFAISFIAAPIQTRLFDPSVMGKINIFNTYASLASIFVLFGLDQAYARFYYERPNKRTLEYLFTFCLSITYSIIFVFFIVALPTREFLSKLLFQEEDSYLLWLFFISIFCSSTLRYLNLSYRMEKNIKLYTIQGILMALSTKIVYVCVGFWDPSYKAALTVLAASHLLLATVFLVVQHNRFEFIKEIDASFSKEIFKYALPLVPVSLLMWANTSIPQIVMQHTMDYHDIGIFTSAMALANIILIVQSGFNTFWVPYTYENYKTQQGQFYKVHRYLCCVLVFFALFIILFQDVIFLLLGEKYREAKFFFPFLILGPVCYVAGETSGIGIDLSKKTYLNIYVFISSVLTNLILCFILKEFWGVAGIAMAYSSAAVVSMSLKTYFGGKNYKAISSIRYIVSMVCVILLGSFATLYIHNPINRCICIAVLIIFSILFYRLEIVELFQYLKHFKIK